MKNILCIIFIILLTGCLSGNYPRVYKSSEKTGELMLKIETLILKYKFRPDKNYLKEIKIDLDELDALVENNKNLEARALGYRTESEAMQGNDKKVRDGIRKIEKLNKNDESVFILKAYLSKSKFEKRTIYYEGIKKAERSERIKLYLADLLYNEFSDYAKAMILFDEALSRLDYIYRQYYSRNRELARLFIKYPPESEITKKSLEDDEMDFLKMINISLLEAGFFRAIITNGSFDDTPSVDNSSDAMKSPDDIFSFLIHKKYLYTLFNKIAINDAVERKDACYFILRLLADMESDPGLLEKYKADYDYSRRLDTEKNPVKDIKPTDYYYNPVMVLIERELIDLPDGVHFYPKKNMSALEYYAILKKIQEK